MEIFPCVGMYRNTPKYFKILERMEKITYVVYYRTTTVLYVYIYIGLFCRFSYISIQDKHIYPRNKMVSYRFMRMFPYTKIEKLYVKHNMWDKDTEDLVLDLFNRDNDDFYMVYL